MALSMACLPPDLTAIDHIINELTQIVDCPPSALSAQYQLPLEPHQTLNSLLTSLVKVPEVYYFRMLNYCIPRFANEVDKDFCELFPQHPAVLAENDELAGRVTEGIPLLDVLHLATHTDVLLQAHPLQAQLFIIENAPGMPILIEASQRYRQLMDTPQVQCFVNYLYRSHPQRQANKNSDNQWCYRYYDPCFNEFYGD